MPDEDRNNLIEHRQNLVELGLSQIHLFDKTILTLASGALGFSILFLEKLVGDSGIISPWALFVSWSLLMVTILLNLYSYLASWQDSKNIVKKIDIVLESGDYDKYKQNTIGTKIIIYLNYVSIVFFAFGVLSLAIFSYQNLQGKIMSGSPAPIKPSSPPPSRPKPLVETPTKDTPGRGAPPPPPPPPKRN